MLNLPKPTFDECASILINRLRVDDDLKHSFEWHRERDYPTLREGVRRKQIKSLKK